jgi:hypothetical protein
MSRFLDEWDAAIKGALIQGKPGRIFVFEPDPNGPGQVARLVGRTMHPAFMATPMPKHDPERDQ